MQADRCCPAPARLDLRFEADPFEVRAALSRAIARFSDRIGAKAAGTLELALAEALNNVVEHAYEGKGGRIRLIIEAEPAGLYCEVTDFGRALPGGDPPHAGAGLDPRATKTESLREGGWGWHIVQALTQDLGYRRSGDENRLWFRIVLDGRCAKEGRRRRRLRSRSEEAPRW